MTESNSTGQPIITLGVPDSDVRNEAITWVLSGAAFLFLLIVLVIAINSN